MQTINNNNLSLALQRVDVRVYDLTGSPASISAAFYFVLRDCERAPSLRKTIESFCFTLKFSHEFSNNPR
jgi:hypothetical protein